MPGKPPPARRTAVLHRGAERGIAGVPDVGTALVPVGPTAASVALRSRLARARVRTGGTRAGWARRHDGADPSAEPLSVSAAPTMAGSGVRGVRADGPAHRADGTGELAGAGQRAVVCRAAGPVAAEASGGGGRSNGAIVHTTPAAHPARRGSSQDAALCRPTENPQSRDLRSDRAGTTRAERT